MTARALVLASAGSGKTFRLSSGILTLLAQGAEPDQVLASTFTRKAAGEILDRVLVRLAEGALDPAKAEELAKTAHSTLADRRACRALLAKLLGALHRMNVGTLDSFFVRVARVFFQELGLAPGWTLGDKPVEETLRTEAVLAVLGSADSEEMVELLRQVARGAADRPVHDALVGLVDDLIHIRRQIDPRARDPWSPDFGAEETPSPAELQRRRGALVTALREAGLPTNKGGTVESRWAKARDTAVAAVEAGDWVRLFTDGLGRASMKSPPTYYSTPFPQPLADCFAEARTLARAELAPRLLAQAQALGRLADLLARGFELAQRRIGSYRFEDVTHLLGGPDATGRRQDLHYRLDQQIRHLLLDEFQDTSLAHWQALEPLADELLSGHLDERAGLIVADPKQSIYGWRGARPELVRRVGERYDLPVETLGESWRSSQIVLDFVSDVFRDLPDNPAIRSLEAGPPVARAWMEDFTALKAAKEVPGLVRIHQGAAVSGTGQIQDGLLRDAARVVKAVHEEAPGRSVGVLVRHNKVLARLMDELAGLGVPASGEGGTPLTDTPPVNAVLSLLRFADHPGDTVARYHVARTPLGAVVGYTEFQDTDAARRLARRIRARLLEDGYGATVTAWVEGIAPACDRREVLRLLQLVELAHRWDERATLCPSDFVGYVGALAVDDPSAATVKVMTVHQAKGLEFDVVVLPELYGFMTPDGPRSALTRRDPATGLVVEVFPLLNAALRALFPEAEPAHVQGLHAELRDTLSVLYVALTRARHALHLVVPPPASKANDTRSSSLIRHALGLERIAERTGPQGDGPHVIFERGDPAWHHEAPPAPVVAKRPPPDAPRPRPDGPLLALHAPGPGRNLPRRTPSSLEGGDAVELAFHLRLDAGPALRRGDVVHAWCEEMLWVDDGIAADAVLTATARRVAPDMPAGELTTLAADFRRWLAAPEISASLRRGAYPTGPDQSVAVERELPFVRRVGGEVQEGFVDRLVLVSRSGHVAAAHVLDFKTDDVAPDDEGRLGERTERYRPQMEAYRAAVAEQYSLPPHAVRGTLLFLVAGRAVDLG